jgi:ribonuclease-3
VVVGYKDPKTRLQEMLQTHKKPLPIYKVIKIEGAPHSQVFSVECQVEGIARTAVGVGTTKRKAEQNAADLFLKENYEL